MAILLHTFSYTGAEQSQALAAGSYLFKLWGAKGASGYYNGAKGPGGAGGYAEGVVTLAAPATVYVYVGQMPSADVGGWNGGGNGERLSSRWGGAGGGASDIRIGGNTLYDRILVAAGGGGGSMYYVAYAGGPGGGLTGGTGAGTNGGTGGTPSAGGVDAGSFGQGGNGTLGSQPAGGGGGWFGGGAGRGTYASGGGGSSYVGAEITVDAVDFPLLAITDGSTTAGLRTDHGLVETWSVDVAPAAGRRWAAFI